MNEALEQADARKAARAIAAKAMLSSTMADLAVLADAGHALITGKATAWDERALAKAGNMRQNAHYSAEQRGFLAFQSTLDRARTLLREVDVSGIVTVERFDSTLNDTCKAPVDVCYQAREASVTTTGHAALAGKVRLVRAAAQIYVQLKDKFGDSLRKERTIAEIKLKRAKKAKTSISDEVVRLAGARFFHEMNGGTWTPEIEAQTINSLRGHAKPQESMILVAPSQPTLTA